MANRTVKFIGYTPTAINAVYTFNGIEVFNGSVAAAGTSDEPAELFSFDIDRTVSGVIPTVLSVTNGEIVVVTLSANHSGGTRDAGVDANGDAYDARTEATNESEYTWVDGGNNTTKTNITIDGQEYIKGDTTSDSEQGAWHIPLTDNQTMTCDYNFIASPA